jgi:hypothetical protein
MRGRGGTLSGADRSKRVIMGHIMAVSEEEKQGTLVAPSIRKRRSNLSAKTNFG